MSVVTEFIIVMLEGGAKVTSALPKPANGPPLPRRHTEVSDGFRLQTCGWHVLSMRHVDLPLWSLQLELSYRNWLVVTNWGPGLSCRRPNRRAQHQSEQRDGTGHDEGL